MNIQRLHMGNSFLPLWLSYGANAMYVVLFIQFFESLPQSMIEASRIDGCSQLQTFFNIGVVTNFLPATGISLPFFSYGGTALLVQLFEMGLVLSVSRQSDNQLLL